MRILSSIKTVITVKLTIYVIIVYTRVYDTTFAGTTDRELDAPSKTVPYGSSLRSSKCCHDVGRVFVFGRWISWLFAFR